MQTAVVAGGAGFIGSNLCEILLQTGYSVICVDNLLTGSRKNISELEKNNRFEFIEHDITQELPQDLLTAEINIIYHLASPASPNKKSPRSYINYPVESLLVNSLGTFNLLELAKTKMAKFLFASSSEVYGDPTESPQKESYRGNVNPNGERSVYDEAKRFGEAMTFAYIRKQNVDARVIRIFNTYGPKMQPDDGRVVSNFIAQALQGKPITVYGDGKQTRSFCFISDMIKAIILTMESDKTKGEVINLGNPDEREILEIATIVKEMTGSSSDIQFEDLPEDDPKRRLPDISKAKNLLGWSPAISLKAGLEKTIEYFKTI